MHVCVCVCVCEVVTGDSPWASNSATGSPPHAPSCKNTQITHPCHCRHHTPTHHRNTHTHNTQHAPPRRYLPRSQRKTWPPSSDPSTQLSSLSPDPISRPCGCSGRLFISARRQIKSRDLPRALACVTRVRAEKSETHFVIILRNS